MILRTLKLGSLGMVAVCCAVVSSGCSDPCKMPAARSEIAANESPRRGGRTGNDTPITISSGSIQFTVPSNGSNKWAAKGNGYTTTSASPTKPVCFAGLVEDNGSAKMARVPKLHDGDTVEITARPDNGGNPDPSHGATARFVVGQSQTVSIEASGTDDDFDPSGNIVKHKRKTPMDEQLAGYLFTVIDSKSHISSYSYQCARMSACKISIGPQ